LPSRNSHHTTGRWTFHSAARISRPISCSFPETRQWMEGLDKSGCGWFWKVRGRWTGSLIDKARCGSWTTTARQST